MSNNLFSQPIGKLESSTPNQHIGKIEASVPHMLMGPKSNNDALQQISLSNEHIPLSESITSNKKVLTANMHTGWVDVQTNNIGPQQFMIPNNEFGGWESMLDHTVSNKRKTPTDSLSSNSVQQRVTVPNKKPMLVDHRPWMQQLPLPNMKNVPMQTISNVPGHQLLQPVGRKVILMDSIPKRPGPQQLLSPKNQTVAQMQPSPKTPTNSFGPIRFKLRESLAAALALVTQPHEKPNPGSENNEVSKSTPVTAEAPIHVSEKPTEDLPYSDQVAIEKHNDESSSTSHETTIIQNTGDSTHTGKCVVRHEFQLNPPVSEIDVSFGDNFFVKDELLQGNGLSWALDVDIDEEEKKELQNEDIDVVQKELDSPETLGLKIETELFKLFGGVNKKYKEKGRSLIFNLKDRSNPELRERVMSGDISPERLCSMTAEELASKELSEWRIAKAEEFAHMVVLPDSDVDMRRLVKKTHKGEFQVEYDQDDNISVEVSAGVGASSLPPIMPRPNKKTHASLKIDKTKHDLSSTPEINNLEEGNVECTLTIPPNEEADLMLDELKDADFLPPIVSLDEFMESLDTEPPFENLPLDSEKLASSSDKIESKLKSKSKSSDSSLKGPSGNSSDKTEKLDAKVSKSDAVVKSSDSPVQSVTLPGGVSKDEQIWEGSLQLNPSAVITVIGFYKSGEKTPTKEWPSLVEIKGRVKLEDFEKFIHALSMSRSRTVMVTHLVLKDDNDRANLSEVADSYLLEERVGLAEPCTGVEIYVCPTHAKTLEMLKKHLPKHAPLITTTTTNGCLIGVVVTKKLAHQNTSSSSSSHHKHSLKKQSHHNLKRQQNHHDKDVNVNKPSIPPLRSGGVVHGNNGADDDDDDVPPGFGPGAVKDDDDLPEFNFSGDKNPLVGNRGSSRFNSQQPVKQIRDLIYKYGQPDIPAGTRKLPEKTSFRWKNDDDDDMPEWQPQSLQQKLPPPPPPPAHVFQQQMLRPHMVNQQQNMSQLQNHQSLPMQHVHPQMGGAMQQQQPQNGGAWAGPPPFSPHGYPPVHGTSKGWP